ncbi:3'-5' exoribonuclease YhaM family protein [Synoicihabitans lomoniglobus]|uniref:HD domain-containing protein n=1 Tax=Synoicihabitans lomoniglobus TaxID=2909285 RepID=A0AAF0I559_9BACT|nr:HD domain-containing protein [Opitutaceae bacterium LMO-M01]WED67198.1 HD domain-containing protein [Opitutaceae bacterium LMO-M01]
MAETPRPSVADLKALDSGKPFSTVLLLRKVTNKTASNGNPFLSLEFGDRTGSFSATLFNDHAQYADLASIAEGAALAVEGRTDAFQGRFSPRLGKVDILDEAALEASGALTDLVEVPPEDPHEMWTEFESFIDAIKHDELRMTVRAVFEEIGPQFRNAPAATAMHHAYRHGLLEHTLHMARACQALLPLYREVDPDLAMAGILVHDTGKVTEYEGALGARRSRKGILQGHVVLGYAIVRKAGLRAKLDADRLERLEHIVLSHQGEPAWGAAAWAATPEAVFVSMIDNLDARMGMVQRALRTTAPTEQFSERLMGLQTALLTEPLPADEAKLL